MSVAALKTRQLMIFAFGVSFEFYGGLVNALHGETIDIGPEHHCFTRREPFGVVGVITPWNAPLNQAARAVAPALAAGNVVVLKPRTNTALETSIKNPLLNSPSHRVRVAFYPAAGTTDSKAGDSANPDTGSEEPEYEMTMALMVAANKDPEMLRTFLDIAGVIAAPAEVFARPGLFEKVIEFGSGWRDEQLPGLSREELLAVVRA